MYPYFRLAKVLLTSSRRVPVQPGGLAELPMRVWPSDLDAYPEQNNGRHLTLMDLGRYDYAVRIGLFKVVKKRRWAFMIAGSSVRYRHRLRAFQRYTLATRLLGADERFFYFHQFTHSSRGAHSSALVRGALTSREGLVPVAELRDAMNMHDWNPQLPEWAQAWIDADALRPWPPAELEELESA